MTGRADGPSDTLKFAAMLRDHGVPFFGRHGLLVAPAQPRTTPPSNDERFNAPGLTII